MFNFKKVRNLENELFFMEKRALVAEANYAETAEKYNELISLLTDNTRKAPIYIDFSAINIFSIERLTNQEGVPMTAIGYFVRDTSSNKYLTKEWYYHCNEELHNQLVADYKHFVESRKHHYG